MCDEYGIWPESTWRDMNIDWSASQKITAGVDVGTTSTQAVILCDGKLFAYSSIHTGADFQKAADRALHLLTSDTGMALHDFSAVGGTGFGKKNVRFATKSIDEIQCHAVGARFMYGPEVRTVVDMGGQTIKAIRLFDWNRVRDFAISDKCATGEGRSLETLCDLIHIGIEEIGPKSLDVEKDPEPVSTTCYAFANTETLGLFGRPEFKSPKLSEGEIYASHIFAYAWRILGVIGKLSSLDAGDIRIDGKLAFTGGLARNIGITKRIERELAVESAKSDYDPMLAGAVGAAILA